MSGDARVALEFAKDVIEKCVEDLTKGKSLPLLLDTAIMGQNTFTRSTLQITYAQ